MIKIFKMLSGYCYVLDDRILFLPTPDLNAYSDFTVIVKLQDRMAKIRGVLYPIFIFFTLLGFYLAVINIMESEIVSALLFLGMGIVLLRILLIYLLSNPTLMIKREDIISLRYQKEITWLGIWPMFVVKFRKGNGRQGRKLIVMKYTMSDFGRLAADRALEIFKEEGLLDL